MVGTGGVGGGRDVVVAEGQEVVGERVDVGGGNGVGVVVWRGGAAAARTALAAAGTRTTAAAAAEEPPAAPFRAVACAPVGVWSYEADAQ